MAQKDDVANKLVQIETDRRAGKMADPNFYRSINAKKALSMALIGDQEKASARKRFGKNYTEANLKEPFKSTSSRKMGK